jgi:hypothetical protein
VENLYASREGQVRLATLLSRAFADISAARKSRSTIPPGMSRPSDIKRAVIEALRECDRYSISPPAELIDLVERLFESAPDNRRRNEIRFPALLIEAARAHVETNLSGRALARELRKRGFKAADRTVARYQKDPRFSARVKQFKRTVPSKL